MAKGTGFSNYWWDKEFQELPVMYYYKDAKKLDLGRSSVNIVPAGLRGVDTIELREKPIAIAPDFKGKVRYEWSAFCVVTLPDEEVKKAKATYRKYKKFCETPHSSAWGEPHTNYMNLPTDMHFVRVGDRVVLDLRQSNVVIKQRSDQCIGGVKALILPTDRADKVKHLLRRMYRSARQRQ